MLFVIATVQVIGCAASLSEPLHWLTVVTKLVELLVNVPFPDGHGSSEHSLVTVVVELVTPLLIVLTTVTVQVKAVVAPAGPGPKLLHWSTTTFAACADVAGSPKPTTDNPPIRTTNPDLVAQDIMRRVSRNGIPDVGRIELHSLREACQAPTGQPGTNGRWWTRSISTETTNN
jgi:hypothetical protein